MFENMLNCKQFWLRSKFKSTSKFKTYILLAYICGFDKNRNLMSQVCQTWYNLSNEDPFQMALNGQQIIHGLNEGENFYDLRLILLFKH